MSRSFVQFVALLALPLFLAAPATAQALKVHGLELVPWSKRVEKDRYESARDYDGTLKHFRDTLRGVRKIRWHKEVNLPQVKYLHIQNLDEKSQWAGVNIYALPSGQVRMYVVARPKEAATKAAKGAFRQQAPGHADDDGAAGDDDVRG